jgi:hypothetical protein
VVLPPFFLLFFHSSTMRLLPLLVLVSTELAAGFSLSGHVPTNSPRLLPQSTPYPFLKLRAGLRRSRHSGVSMKRKGEKDSPLDPYVVLGVQRKATMDDIKRAYRKLSQTYHPDVNSEEGAKDKFIEISVAYSVLGDEDERYARLRCKKITNVHLRKRGTRGHVLWKHFERCPLCCLSTMLVFLGISGGNMTFPKRWGFRTTLPSV